MAEKNGKKRNFRKSQKDSKRKDKQKEQDLISQLRIAYGSLEDPKKFYKKILFPLIILGALIFIMPFIINQLVPIKIEFNQITFVVGGIIPIFLGCLYPLIHWKNKESDINGKMHFFITHLRVLAISDLSLKDIINMIGGKPVYGSLGNEMKKISALSTQWRLPLSKSFRFVSKRTPSKLLKDFLDRFSQSIDSGVEHREFIEIEQKAVLQEYKTMYETSNDNIVIINEVYVSMLISIIFVMSLGIVLPFIMGAETITMFVYLSSFMLIVAEGMLLYLLRAMAPPDEIWHLTGEKGELDNRLSKYFKSFLLLSLTIGSIFFILKFSISNPLIQMIPFEIIVAVSITPLLLIGIETLREEENISRKERNFLGFLPSLGSISTMRGGKINESIYYLSEKDYGVLTKHIRNLYRRLRTRINDDDAWEWFGVDTGSNYIQRASEMFREATYAAANPRTASRMIAENIRKIRDLRVKKITIVKSSTALFGGITFGISFAIYISLIISKHLNEVMIATGDPFSNLNDISVEGLLETVPPEVYYNIFLIIFIVLFIHSFMMAITIKTLRGSHIFITFLYLVPFVWIIAITSVAVEIGVGGYLGI